MGQLLILAIFPAALLAPIFRIWMRTHKSRCLICPPDPNLYCCKYLPVWRAINKSRLMLARARWAAESLQNQPHSNKPQTRKEIG